MHQLWRYTVGGVKLSHVSVLLNPLHPPWASAKPSLQAHRAEKASYGRNFINEHNLKCDSHSFYFLDSLEFVHTLC